MALGLGPLVTVPVSSGPLNSRDFTQGSADQWAPPNNRQLLSAFL